MSREKISRKKLLQEPDEFLSLSQKSWLWVNRNREKTMMIAGGLAAAVLVAVAVKGYRDRSVEQRSTAVATAVARYAQAPAGAIPADLRQELGTLADRYAGSPEGAIARFFHAGALATAGETEKARQLFNQLATPGGQHVELSLLARQALAQLDLAGGAVDAALSTFEDLLKAKEAAVPRAQIMLEIAAIHEKQGRAAEASRLYRELLAGHPDGSWAATAKERLRLLKEAGSSA